MAEESLAREPMSRTAETPTGHDDSPSKSVLLRAKWASGLGLALLLLCGLMFRHDASTRISWRWTRQQNDGMPSAFLAEYGQVHFSMRPGAKRDNDEWQVINSIVHVRSSPSTSASSIGMKQQGQIVIGDENAGGDWLQLRHEPGWVAISLGGTPYLQRRLVTYSELVSGSCSDLGNFPVTEKDACIAAARALGHNVEQLGVYTGGDPRPEGCYLQGSKMWMEADVRNRGRGSLSGDGAAMEQFCSSGIYARITDGYMDQQAVAERLNLVDWALSESKSLCPLKPPPPYPCVVLWSLRAQDFVQAQFGNKIGMFEQLRAYFMYQGCAIAVSEDFAKDWTSWKLGPFWASTLPNNQWQDRFNNALACGDLILAPLSPPAVQPAAASAPGIATATLSSALPMKCEQATGVLSEQGKALFTSNPAYNGPGAPTGVFNGAYDLMLQTLGPSLQAYRTPFSKGYVGIHIRRGERVDAMQTLKGNTTSAIDVLKKYWPHMKNVFLAFDDVQLVQDAADDVQMRLGSEYTIRTTKDKQGSTPQHDAVLNVLDDICGLTSASVIIGSSTSNVFGTVHTTNVYLHGKMNRHQPWCYDVNSEALCN